MDWYPRYPGRYDRKTLGLSLAEHGAYSRLLDYYYQNESPLPDDDAQLAAILRRPLEEWQDVAKKVRAFFVKRGGKLHQLTADEEIAKYHSKGDVSRENGKKGGRPKGSKTKNKKVTKPGGNPAATQEGAQKKPQRVQTNKQTDIGDSPNGESPRETEISFAVWFELFPEINRGAEGPAQRLWDSTIRRGRATAEQLMAGLHRYRDAGFTNSRFACSAERWLKDERWTVDKWTTPTDAGGKVNGHRVGMAPVAPAESIRHSEEQTKEQDERLKSWELEQ